MISGLPIKRRRIINYQLSSSIFSFSPNYYHYHCQGAPLHEKLQQHQQFQLLLQACSRAMFSGSTKALHALTIITGASNSIFISNNLVTAYASLGELSLARNLFDKMPERNVISYNSIITAYNRHGYAEQSSKLFYEMMGSGIRPTQFTFGNILSLPCLDHHGGLQLYPLIVKIGLLHVDAFTGTALLGLFGREGYLDGAFKLFEDMPVRNVVTWNSIIAATAQHECVEDSVGLFRELMRTGIPLTECSFQGILSAFRSTDDMSIGEQVHGLVIKTGTDFYALIANALVDMYAKCFCINAAEKMFNEMSVRDTVSWNLMIAAFMSSDGPERALELFLAMCALEVLPSQATFANVVSACTSIKVPEYGQFIHAKTIKNNLNLDVFVGSALIDFYAKCNKLEDAHLLFIEIPEKNVVSWNTLMSGYSTENSRSSVYLFQEMLCSDVQPNEFSFSAVIKSSSALELQQLHSLIIRLGYDHNVYVSTSIIASYALNGLISDALTLSAVSASSLSVVSFNTIAMNYNRAGLYGAAIKLLSQVEEPDIISWNILIEACARRGEYKEAFKLFKDMQTANLLPDNCTFVCLLSICTKLCNRGLGSSLHALIIKTDFRQCDVFTCNVLIDMYAKCGSLECSIKLFDRMVERNLISWTALVSALGLHGYPLEALKRYEEMESLGFNPDRVAFVAILSACRHGGLIEEGMRLFERMKVVYRFEPEMCHYLCIVDMLSRNGCLKEAEQVICSMPFRPNAVIWRTFLEGCRRYGNIEKFQPEGEGELNLIYQESF